MIAKKQEICLILDNIRSVHNVGSIFRTAEAAGVQKIYCIGTTPTPLDRFNKKRKDFAKVSLGAEELVAWEHVTSATKLINRLKKEEFYIIVVEQAKNSIDYRKVRSHKKTALIFGNEVNGVSQKLLKLSDCILEIPLRGRKSR